MLSAVEVVPSGRHGEKAAKDGCTVSGTLVLGHWYSQVGDSKSRWRCG